MRKTLFISDLHLDSSHPAITQQFLDLLLSCHEHVDALYILGDLFDTWIGDDDMTPLHRQIIQALRQTTDKGLPVYVAHGNRDFLIGKQFLRQTGCCLLAEEEKIMLYGTPVLLMHGDILCTRDIPYLRARKIAKNRFYQFLFLSLPLFIRKKIADRLRAKSMTYTQSTPEVIMDVTQTEVERVMTKHHVTYLIHGHTNRPGTHSFVLNGRSATRIVLGAWHDGVSVYSWKAVN